MDIVKYILVGNGLFDFILSLSPDESPLSVYGQLSKRLKNIDGNSNSKVIFDIIRVVFLNAGLTRIISAKYLDSNAGKVMAILSYLLEATIFGHLLYKGDANNEVLPLIAIPLLMCGIIVSKWGKKQNKDESKSN